MQAFDRFRLDGRTAIVTGGAGLLGLEHAHALAEAGATVILWDIADASAAAAEIGQQWQCPVHAMVVDITNEDSVRTGLDQVLPLTGGVHVLVNNAANNPKVNAEGGIDTSRLEHFPMDFWLKDIAVGLTGAFLCSRVIGAHMAAHGGGTILNIASDLGVIAPDQRLYRKEGLADDQQPVKPVTYSVVKHGLVGLTRYLATYWNEQGVRANVLAPGGVYNGQPDGFVAKLAALIPMGRMANRDEYRGAVQFLCSDASSYMNGAVVSVDGGRSAW